MRLKIEPELRFHVEKTPEPEGGIGRDAAPAMDNFIDAPGGDANILGQPILADSHRFQKFRQKDFTGVNGGKIALGHGLTSLMVIDDLDVIRIAAFPDKADAPLLIDSDAVLPFTVMMQRLQIVGRGDAHVSRMLAAFSILSLIAAER